MNGFDTAGIVFILQGFVSLNLIFAASSLFIRGLGVRISGASVIASLTLTWPSILILCAFFPESVKSKWIVALFMVCALFIYILWLKIFEPYDVKTLAKKDLKKMQIQKIGLAKDYLKKQIVEKRKAKEPTEQLEGELKQILIEERKLKSSLVNFQKLKRYFVKKEA